MIDIELLDEFLAAVDRANHAGIAPDARGIMELANAFSCDFPRLSQVEFWKLERMCRELTRMEGCLTE